MEFVASRDELLANAFQLADAIHDGNVDEERAKELVGRGRVFFPFRYGDQLAFAPAKFIGYRENSVGEYDETKYDRNGGEARRAISRVLGFDAAESAELDRQLSNYCQQIGVELYNNRHSFWIVGSVKRYVNADRSAIRDLDPIEIGNDDPEYRRRMAGSYVRDQSVRKAVLARANGKCELCGTEGFAARNGARFLETHHVISLSEQGPDKVSNVIALCPNDHRRAHFGEDWQSLQDTFLELLSSKK
jgi:hypothetical protein